MKHDSVVSFDPVDATPWLVATEAVPRPRVDTIGQIGSTIFVGGLFNKAARPGGAPEYGLSNFMAFDSTAGTLRSALDPNYVDPSFNGPVWAIATLGNAVYVGGRFSSVNGIVRNGLVKLDAQTGAVDPIFNAEFAKGIVRDLQMWTNPDGTWMLIVGGSISKKLIALDPETGSDTGYFDLNISDPIPGAWGRTAVYQLAIDPSGTKLVATGNFLTVDGQARSRLFVANLGRAAATLDDWYYPGFAQPCASDEPRRVAYLQGVDFSPDGAYFVVAATGEHSVYEDEIWPKGDAAYHTVCAAAARFDVSDDDQPVWINYTGGDSLWAVVVTGAAVYVQGHNRWLDNPYGKNSPEEGAVERSGIGAIDAESGKALNWWPRKPAMMGGKAFLATSTGLWVGSDSERFNNELHRGIAFVPLP
ncbi:MAG: hypothetical protein M3454_15365 [Actinomycetota bacterium]|nr:hypothetical protein [Actinomycetota bacterium]